MKRWTVFTLLLVAFAAVAATSFAQAKKAEPPRMSASNDIAKGKAIYSKHCQICHYAEAEALKMAPGLKGIYKKGKYADGKKVDDASMRVWIEKGGPKMPPFREDLNDAQIADLIAYIRTL